MKNAIDKNLGRLLVLLMIIITLDVLWGVFTRYALSNQASWSEELARFLLIWIGLLGAAYASGQKMHLAIEILKPKLQKLNQYRLEILIAVLILFFATAVMVIGGIRLVYVTHILQQRSAALQIPMAIVYTVVPLSGLIILYYQVYALNISIKKGSH